MQHGYDHATNNAFGSPELPAFSALLQPRAESFPSAATFTYEPIASLAVGRATAAPHRHAYPQFPLPSFRLSASPVADDSDGSPTHQRRVSSKRSADDSPTASTSASLQQLRTDDRRPARASRYLREVDRHEILQRIENGEKQADLAKEYNVSRAAISNLKQRRKLKEKQQRQQLSHAHSHSHTHSSDESTDSRRSAVRPALLVRAASSPSAADRAALRRRCVVRGASTALLLSQLQHGDPQSVHTDSPFRLSVQRLSRLLLEEAMGRLPTQSLADGSVAFARPVCAIAVGDCGRVLLDEFHTMEPTRATGAITLDATTSGVRTELACAPAMLAASSVLLLQLAGSESGEETVAAVETLVAAGVDAQQIVVVTLVGYESALAAVVAQKPRLGAVLTTHTLSESSPTGEDLAQKLQAWLAFVG